MVKKLDVEEVRSFLDTVCGKLPKKDRDVLKEIRDRIATLTEEVAQAQCHNYGLKDRVYFAWKAELQDLKDMFDAP